MKTCPVCGCDALEGAVIQERRRIRRAIAGSLRFLRTYNANDFGERIQAATTIDRATRAPKRRPRNAR